MATCNICKYAGTPSYKSPCSECKGFSKYEYEKHQTNADRIRSMTDQELAVFLSRDLKEPCGYCQLEDLEGACTETLCDDAMMKWLQQPAEPPKEE